MKGNAIVVVFVGIILLWVVISDKFDCLVTGFNCLLGDPDSQPEKPQAAHASIDRQPTASATPLGAMPFVPRATPALQLANFNSIGARPMDTATLQTAYGAQRGTGGAI